MNQVNLFLFDMSHRNNTSGVDRYLNVLIEGLQNMSYINIVRISLVEDKDMIMPVLVENKIRYIHYTLPLPTSLDTILKHQFWMEKYSEQVYRLTKHLYANKEHCIYHIHTLNVIDLVTYIRERHPGIIVTHLHCIPWKGLYNINKKLFNKLYYEAIVQRKPLQSIQGIIQLGGERRAYECADYIVCVTECGKHFIQELYPSKPVVTIWNGMTDTTEKSYKHNSTKQETPCQCLYVGSLSESKGLVFILKALREVQERGYKIQLLVIGQYTNRTPTYLYNEFPDVDFKLLGLLPYPEVEKYYKQCCIGIIGSLQEQASYVALEMQMFGLPIITTDVDGLHEMFRDGTNALKVPVRFSFVKGLHADVQTMANHIVSLINNIGLRTKLSENARRTYECKYQSKFMIDKTIEFYNQIIR